MLTAKIKFLGILFYVYIAKINLRILGIYCFPSLF